MTLAKLKNNQDITYRIGRAGESGVIWYKWKTGKLYVSRRDVDLPKKYRNSAMGDSWKAGSILTLLPQGEFSAEFRGSEWSPEFKCFNAEDWYLEIKGLK